MPSQGARAPGRAPLAALEALAVVLIGALLCLLFKLGPLNGDAMWALIWGDQLSGGALPNYQVDAAATPHPLATLLGTAFAVLGRDGAYAAVVGLGYFAYAALLVGTFRLGRLAFSWAVGLVAVAVMATSISLLSQAAIGYLDVTSAALTVWAAALESRRPRRGAAVLVLLALAGLQRPELWLLSGVYWLYLFPGLGARGRVRTALLALAAPLLWAVGDLLVTGDPFFSFGFTHETVAGFASDGSHVDEPTRLNPVFYDLRSLLRLPGVLGGLVGLALALAWRRTRSFPTVALVLVTGLAVELESLLGLGILDRFLFPTACALAVLFGFATFGWLEGRSVAGSKVWVGAGLAIFAVYCATAPTHLRAQAGAPDRLEAPAQAREDLRSLVLQPRVRAVLDRCGPVLAPPILVPYLLYYVDRPPGYAVTRAGRGARTYVRPRTAAATAFSGAKDFKPSTPGFREVARNGSWALTARSCAGSRRANG